MTSKFTFTSNLESDIKKLFADKGIQFYTESPTEANIYCPFHKNTNSPAFYINLKTGLWQCFNPSCNKKGNFRQLYKHLTGKSYQKEFIVDSGNLQNQIDMGFKKPVTDELSIDSIEIDYESDQINLLNTLIERGFTKETLEYLEIGFSKIKERIVIPVRNPQYKVVGLIGRAILEHQEPRYLYNTGFKRAEILFNIQNAKFYDECIVVEGSLDCAKVIQAGFKNCVATLGAKVSDDQIKMLRKYFDKINIFSDKDEAGDAMASAIIRSCDDKALYKMSISDSCKDPGEMSEQEIQHSYNNKQLILGGW